MEVAGSLVSGEVAVPAGDGLDQRQDPRPDGPQLREAAVGRRCREPQPRGSWLGNYFRYGDAGEKFSQIDSYVHERLAILASAKHGLTGRNWVTRFDHEWCTRLGVYRLSGTVQPTTAYASR